MSARYKKLIEQKVKELEIVYDLEIVPVVEKSSDQYSSAHFKLSLFFVLLTSLFFTFFQEASWLEVLQGPRVIIVELLVGFLGYNLAHISFFKKLMLSQKVMKEESMQRASELFFALGLTRVQNDNALLIYVTKLEKRVVFLSGKGNFEQVSQEKWDQLVESAGQQLTKNGAFKGLHEILDNLKPFFDEYVKKAKEDKVNQVEDHLILK